MDKKLEVGFINVGQLVKYSGEYAHDNSTFIVTKKHDSKFYDIESICKTKKGIIETILSVTNNELELTDEWIICSGIDYSGIIIAGRKHKDCYSTLSSTVDKYGSSSGEIYVYDYLRSKNRGNEGFITSANNFVDRKMAWKIAKLNNQIKFGLEASDNGEESYLISENLFGED